MLAAGCAATAVGLKRADRCCVPGHCCPPGQVCVVGVAPDGWGAVRLDAVPGGGVTLRFILGGGAFLVRLP